MLRTALVFALVCKLVTCDYYEKREEILGEERFHAVGGRVKLTKEENILNEHLVKLKRLEFRNFEVPMPFTELKPKLVDSKVIDFLREVPKGASLHTHILASTSLDYLIKNITYRDNLYACDNYNGTKFKLKFFREPDSNCDWKSLAELRKANNKYDAYLVDKLSWNKPTRFSTTEQRLNSYFTAVYDMLTNREVFEDYIYEACKELYDDKIIYAEFRGTFMIFYDLDGTFLNAMDTLAIIKNAIQRFVDDTNGKFVGATYIVSVYRRIPVQKLLEYKKDLNEALRRFPQFVVGFDLIGHEDSGLALKNFTKELMHPNVAYYFHAGETNWYGHEADENILDAILLGAKRLGHAYSLAKHPRLMQMVKQEHIGLELSPISNQILGLVVDFRNHPGAIFLANGLPVIICNDDPTLWNSKGLIYDWYVTFVAMTHKDAGLQVLKELALNSLYHSSLKGQAKTRALKIFDDQWTQFVQQWMHIFKAIRWMFKV